MIPNSMKKWMEIAASGAVVIIFVIFISSFPGEGILRNPYMLAMIVTVAVVIFWQTQKQKKKNKALKEQGIVGEGADGESQYQGFNYSYNFFEGGKNVKPYFSVTVRRPSPGAFTIAREKAFDRFFVRLGVCSKIETHDPEFDNEFYITSETPRFVRQLLNKPEKRRAVMSIFKTGFNEIKDNGLEITAVWRNYPRETMEIKDIEAIVAKLGALEVEALYSSEPVEIEQTGWKAKRFIAFAIPVLLLICGIVGLLFGFIDYPPMDKWEIVFDSLKYSIPLLIFYIWVAIQLLKGRSTSHKELMAVFTISIVGFIIGGIGGEMALNGLLDKSEPTTHVAKVIDKYIGKDDDSPYATLESWRKGYSTENIKVEEPLYKNLKPGLSWIEVTTKPGKFGFEWRVGYKLQMLEN